MPLGAALAPPAEPSPWRRFDVSHRGVGTRGFSSKSVLVMLLVCRHRTTFDRSKEVVNGRILCRGGNGAPAPAPCDRLARGRVTCCLQLPGGWGWQSWGAGLAWLAPGLLPHSAAEALACLASLRSPTQRPFRRRRGRQDSGR